MPEIAKASDSMHALQNNQIEKAFALVDSACVKSKPLYKDSLTSTLLFITFGRLTYP